METWTMIGPNWYQAALREIGQRELPENRGPVIRRYIAMGNCGQEGDPWCAIFVNAMLEAQGVMGTRSPSSQSFRHHTNFQQLKGPALGAIAVFWRISRNSGLGHVGFYAGEDKHHFIDTVGGNESDMVRAELLNSAGAHFGLVGYYWPKQDKHGNVFMPPAVTVLPPQVSTSVGAGKVT